VGGNNQGCGEKVAGKGMRGEGGENTGFKRKLGSGGGKGKRKGTKSNWRKKRIVFPEEGKTASGGGERETGQVKELKGRGEKGRMGLFWGREKGLGW